MRWARLLEPEETVGLWWNRLRERPGPDARHPDAAARLADLRGALETYARILGADPAARVAALPDAAPGPWTDGGILALPVRIARFPDPALNRDLYFWLAAFLALLGPGDGADAALPSPGRAAAVEARLLARWPGLRPRRLRLGRALAAAADPADPVRRLLLEPGTAPDGDAPLPALPLWGRHRAPPRTPPRRGGAAGPPGREGDGRLRDAARGSYPETARRDPLILYPFHGLLSWARALNLARPAEEDDPDSAADVLSGSDAVDLGDHPLRPSASLRLDLRDGPGAAEGGPLAGGFLLPEWDHRARRLLPRHCRVRAVREPEEDEGWAPDPAAERRIRRVRRQFEAWRPERVRLRAQAEGPELDLDAAVRAACDLRARRAPAAGLYADSRRAERDLAVLLLLDASASTDGWADGVRILDVEKEAAAVLAAALGASGDPLAVHTFTGRGRGAVRIGSVKEFGEPFGPAARRRLAAVRPGAFTRMGAAVRFAARLLAARGNARRLLLVLTDARPSDIDRYDGPHGVEDSRAAVREARGAGVAVHGVAIEGRTRNHAGRVFGRGGASVLRRAAHLPLRLPEIVRRLAA